MYGTIRRYKLSKPKEFNDKVNSSFINVIRKVPGFISYIAIDEAGRISEWNRQAEQTFGWTRDEAMGQALTTLLVPAAARSPEHTGIDAFTRGASAGLSQRSRNSTSVVYWTRLGVICPNCSLTRVARCFSAASSRGSCGADSGGRWSAPMLRLLKTSRAAGIASIAFAQPV